MLLNFQLFYIGRPNWMKKKKDRVQVDQDVIQKVSDLIDTKYKELGSMSYHEASVLAIFIGLVVLWLLRSPGFFLGWGDFLEDSFNKNAGFDIADATPAILMTLLLFILPSEPFYMMLFKRKR